MTVNPEFDRRGTPVDRADCDASPSNVAALKGCYGEYCRQQVSLLLQIIPREAVRPLYRRARIWATKRGLHESKDPMSTLRLFCRDVLPLPPFEVWLVDYETHLVAHVSAGLGLSPLAEPIAVEFRRMEYDAEPWHGTLEVYRGADAHGGGSFGSSATARRATSAPARSSAKTTSKTLGIALFPSLRLP